MSEINNNNKCLFRKGWMNMDLIGQKLCEKFVASYFYNYLCIAKVKITTNWKTALLNDLY